MEDYQIVDLYWARDEAALTESAKKYGRYCHTIAYHILYNAEDAEECVNDAYLGAWKSMPPHRPNRLSTYLGKIVRNFSLNRYEQYHAQKRGGGQVTAALSELEDCISNKIDVEQTVAENLLVEAINQFLYAQPKIKRILFIRRYFYLDPIKDMAKTYKMSESKISSMLFRLRNELKIHLEKEDILL